MDSRSAKGFFSSNKYFIFVGLFCLSFRWLSKKKTSDSSAKVNHVKNCFIGHTGFSLINRWKNEIITALGNNRREYGIKEEPPDFSKMMTSMDGNFGQIYMEIGKIINLANRVTFLGFLESIFFLLFFFSLIF